MIEPAMIADTIRGWPVMSANDILLEDTDAAEIILEQLLQTRQLLLENEAEDESKGRTDSVYTLPDAPYARRLPAFRPAAGPSFTARRPGSRTDSPARVDTASDSDAALPMLDARPSFEAVAKEISARAMLRAPVENEDGFDLIDPGQVGPEERRFAAKIVAFDAAGTLDRSAAEAAGPPPVGRIGPYRFFSDEEDLGIEADLEPVEGRHLIALAAVFNANPMAFGPADPMKQSDGRVLDVGPDASAAARPVPLDDDRSEDLAIKSIFL